MNLGKEELKQKIIGRLPDRRINAANREIMHYDFEKTRIVVHIDRNSGEFLEAYETDRQPSKIKLLCGAIAKIVVVE